MSPATQTLDVSQIYQHPVFQSGSLVESHAYLRQALAEHALRSAFGTVDAALYSAGTQRLQMLILRYGPEVEVTPHVFNGFSLVQMPLRGSVEIDSDGQRLTVLPGQAAVVAPRRHIRLRWSRGCEQLILRVPNSLVQAAAVSGWRTAPAHWLAPISLIQGLAWQRWAGLLQSLMALGLPNGQTQAPADCSPAWLGHVEFSLAFFLLTQQSHLAQDNSLSPNLPAPGPPALEAPLRAVEHYARAHLCAPIALVDLAHAAGVSARTLHLYCQRRFGVGPMVWLRQIRLDAAQQQLLNGGQVTDAAMGCGFGHLGRFSAYYRERFGELPRDTVAARSMRGAAIV